MHRCFKIKNLTSTLTLHKKYFNNTEMLQQDNSFQFSSTKLSEICTKLSKVQKKISSEILTCVFEVNECQSLFRSKLDFKLFRCNISLV